MSKSNKPAKSGERGFGLIDVIIISFALGIIAFVVIANIVAHNY